MDGKNAKILIIVMIALTVFVVMASMQVMKVDNSGYQGVKASDIGKTAPVTSTVTEVEVAPKVDEATIMPAVDENTTAVVEEQAADTVQAAEETVADASATTTTTEVPAATSAAVSSAEPQIHVVTTEGLTYNPLVTVINPGDTVAWENMSSHDTQALEGLIPEGAEYWHSKVSENYQRTFTVEGIYVYKCTPHFGAGMGGAIIVGKPVNLEQIKAVKVSGAAKRLVKKALQVAEKM